MTDRQQREQAITALAFKTQATKFDGVVMAVYLDDPQITVVLTPDLLSACQRLSTAEWFPKLGELVKACHSAAYDRLQADQERMLKLAASNQREPDAPYCDECRDTGWIDSRWCDGAGDAADTSKRRVNFPKHRYCGDGKHHAPHSWTERCECWMRKTQAARDLHAAQDSAKPGRKARYV